VARTAHEAPANIIDRLTGGIRSHSRGVSGFSRRVPPADGGTRRDPTDHLDPDQKIDGEERTKSQKEARTASASVEEQQARTTHLRVLTSIRPPMSRRNGLAEIPDPTSCGKKPPERRQIQQQKDRDVSRHVQDSPSPRRLPAHEKRTSRR